MSIMDESTPVLYLHNGLDGFGAVDIDYGSADVTDHTFVSDGGTLVLDGTITLTNLDIISNATDDTIRVASEDADSVLEIYTAFDTTGDSTLKLSADLADEAGEQWTITSTGATTDLVIGCDDTTPGDPLTRFTISDAGVVTTMGTVNLEIEDSANTSITDIANIQHFTSGTAAAGIGTGLTFDLENGTGTEEEHASIDVVATSSTNGAEDSDVVINQMTAGALAETLRIVSASATDASDYLQFTANTTETNGLVDVLKLKIATGTAANNSGMSISFQPEDATGAEEHASIDILQTTAARATNDTDIIFTQDVNGTLTERVRMDADGANLLLSGATPYITIGDADAENTQINFDGNTADFSFGLVDATDSISLSLGTTLATTEVFKADGTTMTVTDNLVASGTLAVTGVTTLSAGLAMGSEDVTTTSADPGIGTVAITTAVTLVTTDDTGTDPDEVTLAAGAAGQVKYVQLVADTETSGLELKADFEGSTVQILFEDVNDFVWLISDGTEWHVIVNTGGALS